jgi:hypothetical protein
METKAKKPKIMEDRPPEESGSQLPARTEQIRSDESTEVGKTQAIRNIARLEDIQAFSGLLKQYIRDNKLTTPVGGKEWVNFEGWQFAGAAFGISCYTKRLEKVDTGDPTEIMYMAEVGLRNIQTGHEIGNVMVPCSNKEPGKKGYAAYAIASMAQTRAGSKAFRSQIAFIMKSAGFEVTPAEEMDSVHAADGEEAKLLTQFETMVRSARSQDELMNIYKNPMFEKYRDSVLFKLCLNLRKESIRLQNEVITLQNEIKSIQDKDHFADARWWKMIPIKRMLPPLKPKRLPSPALIRNCPLRNRPPCARKPKFCSCSTTT